MVNPRLGAVNSYRPAIPNFAVIDAPLNELMQGKKSRYAPLTFSKEASDAFTNLKLAFCSHATLAHPRSLMLQISFVELS